jgi:hypothetical protein
MGSSATGLAAKGFYEHLIGMRPDLYEACFESASDSYQGMPSGIA